MGRYTGPKVRLSRRVGVPIADIAKHVGSELTLPGIYGYRGGRNTEYGVRLTEKQKLRFYYGMQEKQFRRFLDMATKGGGDTAQRLMQLLESRLDNVLRRLGVARTIWAARQLVVRGHVLVDGLKVDIASYLVQPGQTITFKQRVHKVLRENLEQADPNVVPDWLEWDPAELTARVISAASPKNIPFEVNPELAIAFYGAADAATMEAAPAVQKRPAPAGKALPAAAATTPRATHVVNGVVFGFQGGDAVVNLTRPDGLTERRLIDAVLLNTSGIAYEGQPFQLVVREWGTGGPKQRWETELRPLVDAAAFAPTPLLPESRFDRFADNT